MGDWTEKTLKGCGIGCGIVLLLLLVIGTIGVVRIKKAFEPMVEARESYEGLLEALGAVEDYTPAADGSIPAARVELFLAVRDSLAPDRARLDDAFADFPPDKVLDRKSVLPKVIGVIGAVGGLVAPIAEYAARENEVLLARGMSYGEYFYIYSIAYFSWLDESPAVGPVITKRHPEVTRGQPIFNGENSTFGPLETRRRYRESTVKIAQNQLAAVPPEDPFRAILEEELRRFRSTPSAALWEGGLPEAVERSLAPYRERLERSWDPATNPFQMPMLEKDWDFKWNFRIRPVAGSGG